MDNGTSMSPADFAAMSGGMGGFGGNSFIWIFGLLILMGMFNGGFGGFGNNGNTNAIQADVNRGFDNQNLQAQTRDILGAVTNGTAQSVAAANQVYHDVVGYVGDKYSELARDVAGLAVGQQQIVAKESECCCNTLRAIDANTYQGALNTAALQQRIAESDANTTAQTQKILDAIAGNRMADMQNQINALQLQNAVAGVVRYPSASTYYAGNNPFCGCGCGVGA